MDDIASAQLVNEEMIKKLGEKMDRYTAGLAASPRQRSSTITSITHPPSCHNDLMISVRLAALPGLCHRRLNSRKPPPATMTKTRRRKRKGSNTAISALLAAAAP